MQNTESTWESEFDEKFLPKKSRTPGSLESYIEAPLTSFVEEVKTFIRTKLDEAFKAGEEKGWADDIQYLKDYMGSLDPLDYAAEVFEGWSAAINALARPADLSDK